MLSQMKPWLVLVALLASPTFGLARSLRQDVSALINMNDATGDGELVGVIEERVITSPSRVRAVVDAVQNLLASLTVETRIYTSEAQPTGMDGELEALFEELEAEADTASTQEIRGSNDDVAWESGSEGQSQSLEEAKSAWSAFISKFNPEAGSERSQSGKGGSRGSLGADIDMSDLHEDGDEEDNVGSTWTSFVDLFTPKSNALSNIEEQIKQLEQQQQQQQAAEKPKKKILPGAILNVA